MIEFGNILQSLRTSREWSQAKLAAKIGLSESQIANYETGRRYPSLTALADVARAFGVSTDYLLGLTSHQERSLDVSGLSEAEILAVEQIISCLRNVPHSPPFENVRQPRSGGYP